MPPEKERVEEGEEEDEKMRRKGRIGPKGDASEGGGGLANNAGHGNG